MFTKKNYAALQMMGSKVKSRKDITIKGQRPGEKRGCGGGGGSGDQEPADVCKRQSYPRNFVPGGPS